MLHVLALMARMRSLVNGAGGERVIIGGIACDVVGQGPPALVLTRRTRREAVPLLPFLVQAGFKAVAVDPCDADGLLAILVSTGPANLISDRPDVALEVAARAPEAVLRVLLVGADVPALVPAGLPVRSVASADPETVAAELLVFARQTRRGG
jgi:hypothetical protein